MSFVFKNFIEVFTSLNRRFNIIILFVSLHGIVVEIIAKVYWREALPSEYLCSNHSTHESRNF